MDRYAYDQLRNAWVKGHPQTKIAEEKLQVAESQTVEWRRDTEEFARQTLARQEGVKNAQLELKQVKDALEECFDQEMGHTRPKTLAPRYYRVDPRRP